MIARNQVELIVTAADKPLIEHVRVQPLAPAALQGQFCIGGSCCHADDSGDQREKDRGLVQDGAAIALVEGIEHPAVPYVQPILQGEIHQRNGDDRERQWPRDAPATYPPKAQRRFPKAREEVLAGLLFLV